MIRSFNGTSDAINAGSSASFNGLSACTTVAWINLRDYGATVDYTYMSKHDSDTIVTFWSRVRDFNGVLRCVFDRDAAGVNDTPNSSIVAGKWHHAVMSHDSLAVGSATQIYRDLNLTTTSSQAILLDTTTAQVAIGRKTAGDFWRGQIGHVHVYNRRVALGEVRQLSYYPGSVPRGLLGYWPCWGSPVEGDYSGMGNYGVLSGTTIVGNDPPINGIGMIPWPGMLGAV